MAWHEHENLASTHNDPFQIRINYAVSDTLENVESIYCKKQSVVLIYTYICIYGIILSLSLPAGFFSVYV